MIVCKDHTTPYGEIDAHENAQLEADFNAPQCERCGEEIEPDSIEDFCEQCCIEINEDFNNQGG